MAITPLVGVYDRSLQPMLQQLQDPLTALRLTTMLFTEGIACIPPCDTHQQKHMSLRLDKEKVFLDAHVGTEPDPVRTWQIFTREDVISITELSDDQKTMVHDTCALFQLLYVDITSPVIRYVPSQSIAYMLSHITTKLLTRGLSFQEIADVFCEADWQYDKPYNIVWFFIDPPGAPGAALRRLDS